MDRPKKQKVIKQPQFTGSVQGEIIEKSQKLTEGWLERGFGKGPAEKKQDKNKEDSPKLNYF